MQRLENGDDSQTVSSGSVYLQGAEKEDEEEGNGDEKGCKDEIHNPNTAGDPVTLTPESNNNDNCDVCAICCCEYGVNEELCWSQDPRCVHVFHKSCMDEWIVDHDECPFCASTWNAVTDDTTHRNVSDDVEQGRANLDARANQSQPPRTRAALYPPNLDHIYHASEAIIPGDGISSREESLDCSDDSHFSWDVNRELDGNFRCCLAIVYSPNPCGNIFGYRGRPVKSCSIWKFKSDGGAVVCRRRNGRRDQGLYLPVQTLRSYRSGGWFVTPSPESTNAFSVKN